MELKMNNEKKFFSDFMNAIECSEETKKNGLWLVDALIKNDPENRTKFEVSFKIKNGRILKELRFLNFDASAYSSSSTKGFLQRLNLFQNIMKEKIRKERSEKIVRALKQVAPTPVDLYFGADVKDGNFLFAFWLIFGGVKKDGRVEFRPYDTEKIIGKILRKIGARTPKLKSDILNFGLDIDNKDLFFKIYWLHNFSKEGILANPIFSPKIKKIRESLTDYRYFTFVSEKYNLEGKCQYKKLFIEFLEPIDIQSGNLEGFLKTILNLANSKFSFQKLLKIINSINGRIALVSFEADDTLTFYIRPK
ncbi:hypothetical protein KJA17_01005 [Patescibacteria group bacterium]|nr:hypothetical protein [Patescibacteria group bacterium]